jgi:ribulose-phosphate 3-epimerase
MDIQIIPAILSKTEEDFKRDLEKITLATSFKEGHIHIDFMDNEFVPNQSISPEVIKNHPIRLEKDAHLMVNHPLQWLSGVVEARFTKVLFHIECKDSIPETINTYKDAGLKVGLAINPQTQLEDILPFLEQVDEILVMAIVPGFQGQPFEESSLEKINQLKQIRDEKGLELSISVDGHVNDETAKRIVASGADILIVGSYFLTGDPDEKLERLLISLKPD